MYEQAVKDSENATPKKEVGVRCEKAKSIKEKFERGEVAPDDDTAGEDDRSKKGMDEDMSVFEAGKLNFNLCFTVNTGVVKWPGRPPHIVTRLKKG